MALNFCWNLFDRFLHPFVLDKPASVSTQFGSNSLRSQSRIQSSCSAFERRGNIQKRLGAKIINDECAESAASFWTPALTTARSVP